MRDLGRAVEAMGRGSYRLCCTISHDTAREALRTLLRRAGIFPGGGSMEEMLETLPPRQVPTSILENARELDELRNSDLPTGSYTKEIALRGLANAAELLIWVENSMMLLGKGSGTEFTADPHRHLDPSLYRHSR